MTQSTRRIWIARVIAIAADVVQICIFPFVVQGVASPVNDAVDVVVCIILVVLVGWHIAFIPSFIIKLLPIADLAPTWTIAVLIATRWQHVPEVAEHQVVGESESVN